MSELSLNPRFNRSCSFLMRRWRSRLGIAPVLDTVTRGFKNLNLSGWQPILKQARWADGYH